MSIATRTGDDGQTGLIYGRRVPKTELAVEVYGTVDELNSTLGMARATATLPLVREEILLVQKQLVTLMGELAVAPEDAERYRQDEKRPKLTPDMLAHLDELVKKIEAENITFDGWATPGDSVASAALDVARTVCRRSERLVIRLQQDNSIPHKLVVQYLNRLSDVLWLFARYTETKKG
jgi:cob(I)alamin adenosyltransferase